MTIPAMVLLGLGYLVVLHPAVVHRRCEQLARLATEPEAIEFMGTSFERVDPSRLDMFRSCTEQLAAAGNPLVDRVLLWSSLGGPCFAAFDAQGKLLAACAPVS